MAWVTVTRFYKGKIFSAISFTVSSCCWHIIDIPRGIFCGFFYIITVFSPPDWKQRIMPDSTVVRFFTFQIIQWPKQGLHSAKQLFSIINVTIKIMWYLVVLRIWFYIILRKWRWVVCVHLLYVHFKAMNI